MKVREAKMKINEIERCINVLDNKDSDIYENIANEEPIRIDEEFLNEFGNAIGYLAEYKMLLKDEIQFAELRI